MQSEDIEMSKALEGVKILDLSRVQAGPSCSQLLGFLGADVLKVEDTEGGDRTRWELAHRDDQDSVYFTIFNNNKRCITLNLKTDRGRELLVPLVEWADVVLENFSKGVMDRLGFGYERLKEINPGVIHASIKGFGEWGPYSDYRSFETSAQATAGLMAANGSADGPPMSTPIGAGDSATGVHMAVGILAALRQRDRTGEGQHVEVSMQDGIVNLMRMRLVRSLSVGDANTRTGALGWSGVPQVFKCHGGGHDDYVMIHIRGDLWDTVLAVIGREDLIGDERYDTDEKRGQRPDEVEAIVTEWTSKRTKHDVMRILGEGGVPSGAVLDAEDIHRDPHLAARGMITTMHHPERGTFKLPGFPVQLESSPVEMRPAPLLGQHNAEVYRELLDLTEDDLARLKTEAVI